MGYNVICMTALTLPDPILIVRRAALQDLARELLKQPIVAVDTESNSLYAYRERVCLIQFSHPQADYLVDPLALEDLSPLGELFANPHIEKVFHAAEYDLICLKRDFGFEFDNLFDTMVSARVLGRQAVGLGAMLEEEFGVRLDKRYQRANWGQRPLPELLLNYARLDTHYLIPLRERLGAELKRRGLWELAQEDFRRMPQVNNRTNGEGRVDDPWRINGAQDLTPQKAAVLQALCRYREDVARSSDRPLFKVIGDKTLLEIAYACPQDDGDLRRLSGMTDRQIARHGRGLLAAVQRGLKSPAIHPPQIERPGEAYLARLDGLREWRKTTAVRMGVPSDVVLPRDLMYALAREAPASVEEVREVLRESPWRFERFAREMLRVLQVG
jgi:ribonuclease D